jgi:hypothetical protein
MDVPVAVMSGEPERVLGALPGVLVVTLEAFK